MARVSRRQPTWLERSVCLWKEGIEGRRGSLAVKRGEWEGIDCVKMRANKEELEARCTTAIMAWRVKSGKGVRRTEGHQVVGGPGWFRAELRLRRVYPPIPSSATPRRLAHIHHYVCVRIYDTSTSMSPQPQAPCALTAIQPPPSHKDAIPSLL